jgi:uncharacterized protein involved in exopolysaccharide biosynthesis
MSSKKTSDDKNEEEISLVEILGALLQRWTLVLGVPMLVGAMSVAGSYLIPPTFTSRTSFLPPQQQQSGTASALASLGALAGATAGVKNTGDQYMALIQSTTIADRLVDRFELIKVYDVDFRIEARLKLARSTQVSLGKKDGLISLEVDDHEAKRAAAIANTYVEELRSMTANLALTEAKQRRVFFEGQLNQIREKLNQAQSKLQGTGITAGSLKAEPKATAEGYAKLKAELTMAAVRLQVLQRNLSDTAPEVQQQAAAVSALSAELAKMGQSDNTSNQAGYIGAYRDFKYQEALFDMIARQYEMAKVDESRDGGQLQLVDIAQVAERKSKPKRSLLGLAGFGLAFISICLFVSWRFVSSRKEAAAAES